MSNTITARLDDRLIGELPRFFGGWRAALRELFQNAYRAGARNVTITHKNGILVFADDGAGCDDPQLLLAAGATGWDESKVIEPAGLGVFSLMSKDVAAPVVIQSKGWKITLAPERVLAKKPVAIESGSVHTGMAIEIVMANTIDLAESVEEARGYYPYAVTFNGKPLPVTAWQPEIELGTPVGKVGLRARGPYAPSHAAIWEWRRIDGKAFERALEKATAGDDLREAIFNRYNIHWIVDPRCGVTPKLPDRNDLSENAALNAAARVTLDVAADYFLAEGKAITAYWPDSLPRRLDGPAWIDTPVGHAVLRQLGWRPAKWEDWRDPDIYYIQDDGWERTWSSERRYTQIGLPVADQAIADSINNAVALDADLPYAVVDGKGAKVRFSGLRKAQTKNWGEVWLADTIKVGKQALPFHLTTVGRKNGRWTDEVPIVTLACDADTAVAALAGKAVTLPGFTQPVDLENLIAGYLACHCDDGAFREEWGRWDGGEDEVDWDALRKSLIEQVSENFIGGARAKARQKLHTLQAYLEKVESMAGKAGWDLPDGVYLAHKRRVERALAVFEKRLKADIVKSAKRARLPQ